jgi:hypothetical protein
MRVRSLSIPAVAFAALVSAGCAGDGQPPAEDGEHDEFINSGGVREGTPEAAGVLRLVNTANGQTLFGKVGIPARAASAIWDHRSGPDGQWRTADDHKFETLAELDALSWVGKTVFQKLLAYARTHGYVPGARIEGTVEAVYDGRTSDLDDGLVPSERPCLIYLRQPNVDGLLGLHDEAACTNAAFFATRVGGPIAVSSDQIKRLTDIRRINDLRRFDEAFLPTYEFVTYYELTGKLPGVEP